MRTVSELYSLNISSSWMQRIRFAWQSITNDMLAPRRVIFDVSSLNIIIINAIKSIHNGGNMVLASQKIKKWRFISNILLTDNNLAVVPIVHFHQKFKSSQLLERFINNRPRIQHVWPRWLMAYLAKVAIGASDRRFWVLHRKMSFTQISRCSAVIFKISAVDLPFNS